MTTRPGFRLPWFGAALCATVFAAGTCVAASPPGADAPADANSDSRGSSTVGFEPNQQSTLDTSVTGARAEEGFWDQAKLGVEPRSYLLVRDRDTKADLGGWALGGAAEFRSGWWREQLKVAATVHTSQVLWGPSDKDGTQLFKPGPEGFTVLSEANVTWRFSGKNEGVRIGRQSFELPYLGSHDIRMVPNTFQGIAAGIPGTPTGFSYIAGYVDRIKRKNDDRFVPMSEAAGVRNGDDGTLFAGAQYVLPDGTMIGGIDQYTFDTFNTLFAKIERKFPLAGESSLKGFLQYTDQRSVGGDLIGGFQTSLLSAKLEYKHGHGTFRIGASTTDPEKGIQKPYGNPANYLSIIVEDFDRAGEDAFMVGATYDFGRVGPGDLSTFVNVVTGNTPDTGPAASPDQTEYDATVDWRFKQGWADRLWVRTRLAYVDQVKREGGDDFLDFRIILNYAFDLP